MISNIKKGLLTLALCGVAGLAMAEGEDPMATVTTGLSSAATAVGLVVAAAAAVLAAVIGWRLFARGASKV